MLMKATTFIVIITMEKKCNKSVSKLNEFYSEKECMKSLNSLNHESSTRLNCDNMSYRHGKN